MAKEKSNQVCDVEVKYKWDLKLKLKDRIFLVLKEMESENLQQLKDKIGGDLLSVLRDLKFGGELNYRESKDLLFSRKRLEIIRENLEKKLNKRVKECVEKSLEARKEELKQRFNKKENKNFQSIEEFEEYLKERKDTGYLPKLKFLNEKIQELGIVEEIDLKNFLEDFKKNVGIKVKEQIQTDYDNLVKTDEYKWLFVQFKSIDRCIKLMDGESEIKNSNNSWFKNSLISPALTINIGGKEYIITKGQLDGKKLIKENVDDKYIIDKCMTNGKLDVKKLIKEKVVHGYIIDKCMTKGKLDGKKLIKENVVNKLNSMAEKLNLRGEKYEDSDINSVVDVFLRPFSSEVNDFIDYYVDDILNCIENTDIVYKIFNCLVQQKKIKEEQRKKKDEEERKNREISSEKVKLGKEILRIEDLSKNFSDEDRKIIDKLVSRGKAMKDREDVTAQEVKDEIDRLQRESQPLFQKYAQIAQQNAEREREIARKREKERKDKMLEKLSNLDSVLDEKISGLYSLIEGIKNGGENLERNGSLGDVIERGKTNSFVLYLEDIIKSGDLTDKERNLIENLKKYLQKPGSKFENFIRINSVEQRELNGNFGNEEEFLGIISEFVVDMTEDKKKQLREIYKDMKENLLGFRSRRNKLTEIDNAFMKIKRRKKNMDWKFLGEILENRRMRKKGMGSRLTIKQTDFYNEFCKLCENLGIDKDIAENLDIWLKIELFKERMRKKWGVKNIRGVLNTIIDKKNGKNLNGEQEAIYKEFCKFCMGFVDKKTKMETINAVFDGRVPVELFGEKYEYVDDEKLMRAVLNDLVERFNKPIRRLKSNFEFLQKKRVDWLSRKVSEECILSNIGIKWNELIMSILSRYSKDLLESKESVEKLDKKVKELTKLKDLKDLEKLETSTEELENAINSTLSAMLQFNEMIKLCNGEKWKSCNISDEVFKKWTLELRRVLGLKRLFNCDELSLEEKLGYSEQIVRNGNNPEKIQSLDLSHDEYLEKIFGEGYVKKVGLQKSLDENDGIEREMHPREKEILENFELLLNDENNDKFKKSGKSIEYYEKFCEALGFGENVSNKIDEEEEIEKIRDEMKKMKDVFGADLFKEYIKKYMEKCCNQKIGLMYNNFCAVNINGEKQGKLDFSLIQAGILEVALVNWKENKGNLSEVRKIMEYIGFTFAEEWNNKEFDSYGRGEINRGNIDNYNRIVNKILKIINYLMGTMKGSTEKQGCFSLKEDAAGRKGFKFPTNDSTLIYLKKNGSKAFSIGDSQLFRFYGLTGEEYCIYGYSPVHDKAYTDFLSKN